MDQAITKHKKYRIVLIILTWLALVGFCISKYFNYSYLVKQSLNCEGLQQSELEDIANFAIEKYHYPTLQIAYIDKKGQQSTCYAGWESKAFFSQRVNNSTIYAYASLTKIFTSDAVLSLVRQHEFKLDDKLVEILPELKNQNYKDQRITKITIGQLLSHRAGFDRNISGDNMLSAQPWCPYNIEKLRNIKLDFEPNQKKVYSNTGYCLLSRLIQVKTQKKFISFIEERYHFDDDNMRFIQKYKNKPGSIPLINKSNQIDDTVFANYDYYALASVGGITGSAASLANQIRKMETIASPNILQHSLDNRDCEVTKIDGCHGYMGYEYKPNPQQTFYWRSGSLPNVTAIAIIDQEGGVMVFLTNYRNGNNWIDEVNAFVQKIYNVRLNISK